jgi:lysozyme
VAVDLIDSAVKEAIMLDKAVVDLSHWDEVDSFDDAKVDGVVGIIHKATESNNYFDPTYNQRKKDALAAGLLWGAYHFLRPGNMKDQAQYFVSKAGKNLDLYAADHEDEGVSLDDLKTFLREVKRLTGKSPIVYSGHVLKGQLGDSHDSELSQYRLWLAQYTSGAPSWPKATFPRWWLWQYTEHGDCGGIPGDSEGNLDLNKYDGTKQQLINEWREEVPAKPEPREKRRKPRQTTKRRPRAKAKKAKARGALRKART